MTTYSILGEHPHSAQTASSPLMFPNELHQRARRDLDDAVLALLGVSDPKKRGSHSRIAVSAAVMERVLVGSGR